MINIVILKLTHINIFLYDSKFLIKINENLFSYLKYQPVMKA